MQIGRCVLIDPTDREKQGVVKKRKRKGEERKEKRERKEENEGKKKEEGKKRKGGKRRTIRKRERKNYRKKILPKKYQVHKINQNYHNAVYTLTSF